MTLKWIVLLLFVGLFIVLQLEAGREVFMREKMIAAGLWNKEDQRDPSVSIEAAWEVVEKLDCIFRASWSIEKRSSVWLIWKDPDDRETEWPPYAEADTFPLAICRAALKAQKEARIER